MKTTLRFFARFVPIFLGLICGQSLLFAQEKVDFERFKKEKSTLPDSSRAMAWAAFSAQIRAENPETARLAAAESLAAARLSGRSGDRVQALFSDAFARSYDLYTVREGDTPDSVARYFGMPAEEVYRENNLRDPYLFVGQNLVVRRCNSLPEAEKSLAEALEIRRKEGNPEALVWALQQSGDFYAAISRFDEAEKFYAEWLKIREAEGDKQKLTWVWLKAEEFYGRQGKTGRADEFLEKSFRAVAEQYGKQTAVVSLKNWAEKYIDAGYFARAEKLGERIESEITKDKSLSKYELVSLVGSLFTRTGYKSGNIIRASLKSSDLYEKHGFTEEAERILRISRRSVGFSDSAAYSVLTQRIIELQTKQKKYEDMAADYSLWALFFAEKNDLSSAVDKIRKAGRLPKTLWQFSRYCNLFEYQLQPQYSEDSARIADLIRELAQAPEAEKSGIHAAAAQSHAFRMGRVGRFAEAAEAGTVLMRYQQSQLTGDYLTSMNNVAFWHQQAGNFSAAEKYFSQALGLAERNFPERILSQLGKLNYLFSVAGNAKKSREILQKMKSRAGENPQLLAEIKSREAIIMYSADKNFLGAVTKAWEAYSDLNRASEEKKISANKLNYKNLEEILKSLVCFEEIPEDKDFIVHTVYAGESWESVAEMYNISMNCLYKYNYSPMQMDVGMRLRICRKADYKPIKGETYPSSFGESLQAISEKVNISVDMLLEFNPELSSDFVAGFAPVEINLSKELMCNCD